MGASRRRVYKIKNESVAGARKDKKKYIQVYIYICISQCDNNNDNYNEKVKGAQNDSAAEPAGETGSARRVRPNIIIIIAICAGLSTPQ